MTTMEIYTVEEFQERWDEMISRVENGEHIGIINEDGQAAVMVPAEDELFRIYTENNNEAS
jgi:PHD/YefM family antitoxin component YafN of YafNO toxin-antitoxin module